MFVEMNANAVMLMWGLKIKMAYSKKKKKTNKKEMVMRSGSDMFKMAVAVVNCASCVCLVLI